MATRKSASKKSSAKKSTAKKGASKKAASKKGAASKASAKKAASSKTSSKKKAAASKSTKKAAGKAPSKKASTSKAAGKKAEVTSSQVHLGHVFSLRPRVPTSFKQGDFESAKHQLSEEKYASVPEAARAVAEKALEITHEGGQPRKSTRRR